MKNFCFSTVKGKNVRVRGEDEFFFILMLVSKEQRDLNFWLFFKGVGTI